MLLPSLSARPPTAGKRQSGYALKKNLALTLDFNLGVCLCQKLLIVDLLFLLTAATLASCLFANCLYTMSTFMVLLLGNCLQDSAASFLEEGIVYNGFLMWVSEFHF